MADLTPFAWPASRLHEALEALARRAGLSPRSVQLLSPPAEFRQQGDEALAEWLRLAADHLGLEAAPMEFLFGEVEPILRRAGPVVLRLPGDAEPWVLALLRGGRRRVSVLGPDLMVHRLKCADVGSALCRDIEAPLTVKAPVSSSGVSSRPKRWKRSP